MWLQKESPDPKGPGFLIGQLLAACGSRELRGSLGGVVLVGDDVDLTGGAGRRIEGLVESFDAELVEVDASQREAEHLAVATDERSVAVAVLLVEELLDHGTLALEHREGEKSEVAGGVGGLGARVTQALSLHGANVDEFGGHVAGLAVLGARLENDHRLAGIRVAVGRHDGAFAGFDEEDRCIGRRVGDLDGSRSVSGGGSGSDGGSGGFLFHGFLGFAFGSEELEALYWLFAFSLFSLICN